MISDDVVTSPNNYPPPDQGKMLEEAIFFVKEQSYYMKKAIEMEDISNSLKHGSNIISELRTSTLSPIHYYELYMKVFNELEYLSDFIGDHAKKSNIISELYVSVQQATFILPRLYLLIMVGAHYIKTKKVTAKEILDDITELCKGIQHPMRGLFLRYYLVQICKDKLPDSDPGNENGFLDSFDFLMNNFCESIRLWIRLNKTGHDKKKIDKERLELGLLVGANLVRITQLEGVDINFYSTTALPRILNEINSIDDYVAQKYLLDCLIQAFSDEFHIHTIDEILSACVSSIKSDDGISILITMMNRLSTFLTSNPEALPEGVDIFITFQKHLSKLKVTKGTPLTRSDEEGGRVGVRGYLDLLASFLEFTTTLYPGVVEHVEYILNNVVELLSNVLGDVVIEGAPAQSIVKLLTIPIKTLSLKALELSYNEKLMAFLSPEMRKKMSHDLIDSLVTTSIAMDELSSFEVFFHFVAPLFEPFKGEDNEFLPDSLLEKIKLEQFQICKLIQAIKCSSVNDQFLIYKDLMHKILNGGSLRLKYTLPCLITCSLNLIFATCSAESDQTLNAKMTALKISHSHEFAMEIFKFINSISEVLQPISPSETLKLLILTGVSVDEFTRTCVSLFGENANFMNDMKMMCLNFLMHACNCYEDEITYSTDKLNCLKYMCSAVSSKITILEKDDYFNIAMLLAKYGLNLTRIHHRCQVLSVAAYLFSSPHYYNEQRLCWCLEKCVTVVNTFDFYAPYKLVEALLYPLETSKYFKLKSVTKLIQNKLDQLLPKLSKDEFKTYNDKVDSIQKFVNLVGK
ncbi:hypothetical protein MACK_000673 [Theileria orientalis]|uniref:Vacuolar protein sorting-associated protein 35 n=1 Tax=Theileria orientalis TaxID=68886 RepID=A0A976MAB0_THEOR|nr:hypothetical protein MACK_000673 [Theileria orientalis]